MKKIIARRLVVVKLAMLAEVSTFLNSLSGGYLVFGSTCWKERVGMGRPKDVDILLLERDPTKRLDLEARIDRFNSQPGGVKVDDTLTRVGTVCFGGRGEMFIHGRRGIYQMPDWKGDSYHGLAVLSGMDLVRFSKSLVDGEKNDLKANATIEGVSRLYGLDSDKIEMARVVATSPRDEKRYSFAEMDKTIRAALGLWEVPVVRRWCLTARRMVAGRLIVSSSWMDTDDGQEKDRQFSRFNNFGRRINLTA